MWQGFASRRKRKLHFYDFFAGIRLKNLVFVNACAGHAELGKIGMVTYLP
jgi:hypothetical protein